MHFTATAARARLCGEQRERKGPPNDLRTTTTPITAGAGYARSSRGPDTSHLTELNRKLAGQKYCAG